MDRYLIAYTRLTPLRNLYLTEAEWPHEAAPTSILDLTASTPPDMAGRSSTCLQLLMNLDSKKDANKYQAIFALPRNSWITLPDPPTLTPFEEEFLLGEALFEKIPDFTEDFADYRADGETVEIVPKNPCFTANWLARFAERVRSVETAYCKARREVIEGRDPYRALR